MGGSETDPGIFINWSLRLGTTASRCITFNKFWPISRDLVFDIRILELWVVNEVIMKRRSIPKRDFYSTVVMWNKIGRHKAKEDRRRTDYRDCCFQNGINMLTRNGSHEDIHETEERHFELSNTSLMGDRNIDDELLLAIKNRLAGVSPMPGTLSIKPEAKLHRINELTTMPPKHQFLENRLPSKQKKDPAQASTQVEDHMITELKSQGTSTSHVKVTSRCTQSAIGLTSQLEETPQLRHYSSVMQQADEGYQRVLPQGKHVQSYQSPNRTHQADDQYGQTLKPKRNSFPNHRLKCPSGVTPQAIFAEPSPADDATRNSIKSDRISLSLPKVPDYYGMSSQRPSVSRSVRSNNDEAQYFHHIHELSWSDQRNVGAVLPYQQQLVRAAVNIEDSNPKQSSPNRSTLREESREVEQSRTQMANNPQQDYTPPNRNVRIEPFQDPSYYQDHQQTVTNTREQNRMSPSSGREDGSHSVNSVSPTRTELPYSDHPPARDRPDPNNPPPHMPPQEQTVLAITTQQVGNDQMCRCGSTERNLICCCKKPILKDTEKMETFRECRCPRPSGCEERVSRKAKKEKKKQVKTDKEAKAEEKRRKKEEKEREKAEKARAKEERKKSKAKDKKSKKKGDKNKDCKMCTCCKCCGDEGGTATAQSESVHSEKSKKEKKSKEKKEKKKKKKSKEESTQELRSCDCPAPITAALDECCRLFPQQPQEQVKEERVQSGQLRYEGPSALGYCNDPDIPCPSLANRETGQLRVQSRRSVSIPQNSGNYCCDPVCTKSKQNETTVIRSCSSNAPKGFRSCCCPRTYVANAAVVEQPNVACPAPTNYVHERSPCAQHGGYPIFSPTSSIRSNGMRNRDVTAAPALIFPNEVGHGDIGEAILPSGRSLTDPRPLPTEFSNHDNLLIDLSKRSRDNNTNKRYVPPCVLYLDCTKVKDLCVIIKDKYDDPS